MNVFNATISITYYNSKVPSCSHRKSNSYSHKTNFDTKVKREQKLAWSLCLFTHAYLSIFYCSPKQDLLRKIPCSLFAFCLHVLKCLEIYTTKKKKNQIHNKNDECLDFEAELTQNIVVNSQWLFFSFHFALK